MTTPIDRLAKLSSQRTARTDRLYEAVGALLTLLESHVEVGESATVAGYRLHRSRVRTNVGTYTGWTLRYDDGDRYCWLDSPLGEEGYRHGDFNHEWRGPIRVELIEVARYARQFVEVFVTRRESDLAEIAIVQNCVDHAVEGLRE